MLSAFSKTFLKRLTEHILLLSCCYLEKYQIYVYVYICAYTFGSFMVNGSSDKTRDSPKTRSVWHEMRDLSDFSAMAMHDYQMPDTRHRVRGMREGWEWNRKREGKRTKERDGNRNSLSDRQRVGERDIKRESRSTKRRFYASLVWHTCYAFASWVAVSETKQLRELGPLRNVKLRLRPKSKAAFT